MSKQKLIRWGKKDARKALRGTLPVARLTLCVRLVPLPYRGDGPDPGEAARMRQALKSILRRFRLRADVIPDPLSQSAAKE
jgi:hypothetical protein